jgi:hypothetical protein
MRSLSSDLKIWKDSQDRLVPLVTLYDIEVNDTTTLYLVEGDPTGTGSVTYGGHTYLACAIEQEQRAENVEGDFPSFQLLVSNINGVAGGYIEANELDGRQVTIRDGLLRGTESDYLVRTYTISQARYNRKVASLTLGPPNFFKKKTCARKYQRMRCQHSWPKRFLDDAGCGYPSDVFGSDTAQDMLPCLVNTEVEKQFGWFAINCSKCDMIGSVYLPMSFFIATTSDDIQWEPGNFAAPFAYKKVSGDFELITEVRFMATKVGCYAGILCQSVDLPSSWVYLGRAVDEGGLLEVRATAAVAGVLNDALTVDDETSSWVRMVRSDSTFTCYYGTDGTTWTTLGTQTVAMGDDMLLGLALSSNRAEGGQIWAAFSPFQFRSGGEATCDRTREACRLKCNSHRYGAFPGIPTLR